VALLGDGASDDEVQEVYQQRYKKEEPKRGFRLGDEVPHSGPADGRVVMVEFFDYGCPACREFAPQLVEALQAFPTDVVLYYKHFPLAAHEHSKGAAQAAVAASRQGKFQEMHLKLFENAHAHEREALFKYARELGLDMPRFEKDFAAAEAQVNADKKEGEGAGVQGTPNLYINGRSYEGPLWAKYLKMWIEEELAVNR
jgi:protein-disulfide isomerase